MGKVKWHFAHQDERIAKLEAENAAQKAALEMHTEALRESALRVIALERVVDAARAYFMFLDHGEMASREGRRVEQVLREALDALDQGEPT